MDYAAYVAGITFRFIKPHTPLIPLGFDRITQRLRLGVFLEFVNTKLVHRERETKRSLFWLMTPIIVTLEGPRWILWTKALTNTTLC
jgi:hypothetical protein